MKRRLSLCLSTAVLLGMVPAQAAAVAVPDVTDALGGTGVVVVEARGGADGQALFDAYGPWNTWTEEQRQEAAGWSEDAWWSYWGAYESHAWALVDQYDTDLNGWYTDYYGEPLWGDEDSYLDELREELGLPYPDGINVNWNGTWMDFGSCAPRAVSGRTLVPFRGFYEAAGAKVSYEKGTLTAAWEDGTTVTLAAGDTVLRWNQGEKLLEEAIGEPYAEDGRVYLPVRAAARTLGLEVEWDDYLSLVYLTDWESLREEVDSHFTHLNALLAAASAYEADTVYESETSFQLSGTLYGEKKHDTASLALTGEGLYRGDGRAVDASLTLDLDAGGMEETLFSQLPDQAADLLQQLSGARLEVRMDADEGNLYFRSSLPEAYQDTWVALEGDPLPDVAGEPLTIGTLLTTFYQSDGLYSYGYGAAALQESSLWLQALLGDENFRVTRSGERTVYTLEQTALTIGKRAGELGLLEEGSLLDALSALGSAPDVSFSLRAECSGEKLTSAALDLRIQAEGTNPVEFTLTARRDGQNAEGTLALAGRYLGRVDGAWKVDSVPTQAAIPTAPGEKDEVIPLWTWLEELDLI